MDCFYFARLWIGTHRTILGFFSTEIPAPYVLHKFPDRIAILNGMQEASIFLSSFKWDTLFSLLTDGLPLFCVRSQKYGSFEC